LSRSTAIQRLVKTRHAIVPNDFRPEQFPGIDREPLPACSEVPAELIRLRRTDEVIKVIRQLLEGVLV
jgi:hypothetical protein